MKNLVCESSRSCSCFDFFAGLLILVVSFVLIFFKDVKDLFNPFPNMPNFLDFYYYLIAYSLVVVALFFILRGFGCFKK